MWAGVSKSGSPISRWTISLPCRSSAFARASTSNADSVPSRPMRSATFIACLLVVRPHYNDGEYRGAPRLRRGAPSVWRLGGHFGAPMLMIEVPAGPFTMGWMLGHPAERPPHVVWLDAFAIARTPVTNAQWAAWLAATGAAPPAF